MYSFCSQCINVGPLVILYLHLCLCHYIPCLNVYTNLRKKYSSYFLSLTPSPPAPPVGMTLSSSLKPSGDIYIFHLSMYRSLCHLLGHCYYIYLVKSYCFLITPTATISAIPSHGGGKLYYSMFLLTIELDYNMF